MKRLILGLIILSIVLLSGCTMQSYEKKIVGIWKDGSGNAYEFGYGPLSNPVEIFSGKTTYEGTWTAEDGIMEIRFEKTFSKDYDVMNGQWVEDKGEVVYKYTYEISELGGEMDITPLTGGETNMWIRVK